MNLRRKLNDLATQRAAQITAATNALEANDQTAYDAAMAEVGKLDQQITQIRNLISAQEATPAAVPSEAEQQRAEAAFQRGVQIRSSNEYHRAFFDAVRARVNPEAAAHAGERFGILLNALTESGNNGADGGFLVPVDLQTRINELSRQLVDLSQLVTVEQVTTLSGYRVLDTAPTAGFVKVSEMGTIPRDQQPSFQRKSYSVEDYALIVPISNDLLNDNDAGLLEYLARWMAKKAVLTRNAIILTKLKTLTPVVVAADSEISMIKRVLNRTLDPDISRNAVLLGNQSVYDCLDQLVDNTKRPLLQPDLTAGGGELFKRRPIHTVSNAMLADLDAGSPLFIGDLKQFVTIFERQAMEFATTNVGGNAWGTNSTEGRAIMRLDAQIMDTDAAAYLQLAGGLDADDEEDDGGEG